MPRDSSAFAGPPHDSLIQSPRWLDTCRPANAFGDAKLAAELQLACGPLSHAPRIQWHLTMGYGRRSARSWHGMRASSFGRAGTQTHTLADAAAHTRCVLREADELAGVVAWQVRRRGLGLPLSDYTPPWLNETRPIRTNFGRRRPLNRAISTAPRFAGVN
jgi:hypothetical protein